MGHSQELAMEVKEAQLSKLFLAHLASTRPFDQLTFTQIHPTFSRNR